MLRARRFERCGMPAGKALELAIERQRRALAPGLYSGPSIAGPARQYADTSGLSSAAGMCAEAAGDGDLSGMYRWWYRRAQGAPGVPYAEIGTRHGAYRIRE